MKSFNRYITENFQQRRLASMSFPIRLEVVLRTSIRKKENLMVKKGDDVVKPDNDLFREQVSSHLSRQSSSAKPSAWQSEA